MGNSCCSLHGLWHLYGHTVGIRDWLAGLNRNTGMHFGVDCGTMLGTNLYGGIQIPTTACTSSYPWCTVISFTPGGLWLNNSRVASNIRWDPHDCASRPIDHRAVYWTIRRVRSIVGDRSSTVDGTCHVCHPCQVLSTPNRPMSLFISQSPTVSVPWPNSLSPGLKAKFQKTVALFVEIV